MGGKMFLFSLGLFKMSYFSHICKKAIFFFKNPFLTLHQRRHLSLRGKRKKDMKVGKILKEAAIAIGVVGGLFGLVCGIWALAWFIASHSSEEVGVGCMLALPLVIVGGLIGGKRI